MSGRIGALVAVVGLTLGAAIALPQSAQAATCVARSPENLAAYNQMADELVASNLLTLAQRDLYRCHPDQTVPVTRASTRVVTTPSSVTGTQSLSAASSVGPMKVAAASCAGGGVFKEGINHVITSGAIPEAFSYYSNLRWCYNKQTGTVSDWSGECVGSVTKWGTINGWAKAGCVRNDFIPYALGGRVPGGIDHVTTYQFVNNFTARTMTVELGPVYIWGHFDGTCDWRFGESGKGKVYSYC